MHTYLGGNLAQNLGCFPIFPLVLSVHKQTHIRLKCEKSLNSVAAFVKIMETFVKTALNTLFAKSMCQFVKAATGFVLIKSCGTWAVLTVSRDYLNIQE